MGSLMKKNNFNKLEGIPQEIIDTVNKNRREEKILFIKIAIIFMIVTLTLHFIFNNIYLDISIILIMIFGIHTVYTFLRGIK